MDVLWVIVAVSAAALLFFLAGLAFLLWKARTSDERNLARCIARLRFSNKLKLGLALFRDPRLPAVSRIIAVGVILYLAMPLDLIPDFIPVLGYLDDLLIVLIGGALILRSMPRQVLEEHISRYEASGAQGTATVRTGSDM